MMSRETDRAAQRTICWPSLNTVILDIDECANNVNYLNRNYKDMWMSDFKPPIVAHNCDPHATCTNTIGSFTCACPAGYEGDGVTCTGKFMNKT